MTTRVSRLTIATRYTQWKGKRIVCNIVNNKSTQGCSQVKGNLTIHYPTQHYDTDTALRYRYSTTIPIQHYDTDTALRYPYSTTIQIQHYDTDTTLRILVY